MIPVEEHLARALDLVVPMAPLELGLLDAAGSVLAEDVVAGYPLPPFDNSGMDGYAVVAEDLAGAAEDSPVTLPVLEDVPAGGVATTSVGRGRCVRIMTGAPLPPGADAVVPVEWTDGGIAQVSIRRPPDPGQHIRRAGGDVSAGTTVLTAGTRLGPTQVGLLAAIGRHRVLAQPRPRVVVISTGSELVEPGTPLRPGQIPDSNSYLLALAAREAGAVGYRVGIVPDDPRQLLDALEDQLIRADVMITSGGVSVGAYDVVKEVLGRIGTVRFDKVAMQPGMPQALGTIGPDRTPIFGLPGNPVSSFVSFEVFVRPVLRKLLGSAGLHRPVLTARLAGALSSPPGRRSYARVSLTEAGGLHLAHPVGGPGSHLVASLARADALAVVPEDVTGLPAGADVQVMVLDPQAAL